MARRHNLLINPSFHDGLTGWIPVNHEPLATSVDYAIFGDTSAIVNKQSINNSGIVSTNRPTVYPGLSYAVSAYVLVPAITPAVEQANLNIRITWLDRLGGIVSVSDTPTVVVTEDRGWVRLSGVFVAPTNAVTAAFSVLQPVAQTDDSYFYIDACLFEQDQFVNGYVDNIDDEVERDAVNKSLTHVNNSGIANLPLNADVILNDLILNTMDENDVIWVCTDIDGWWGNSVPESPDIPRGVEDGSYDVTGRYQARTFTLSGVILPPDASYMPAARDRLIAATNLVRKGGWLRTSERPTRAAFVRLAGRPKIDTVNARGRTTFDIPLKAADPIKYHWNDSDPDGLTVVTIKEPTGYGSVYNIGTADVTATFRMIGPMGVGSTVTNTATNETITLIRPLRRKATLAAVIKRELYDGVATLTTSAISQLYEGDQIVVSQTSTPFNSVGGGSFTVVAVNDEPPYSVSYSVPNVGTLRIDPVNSGGTISLASDDVLEVDTYEKSVAFNGNTVGERSRLETLIDWTKLAPGRNDISMDTKIDHLDIVKKKLLNGIVTLTSSLSHQLDPTLSESVQVTLPTEATIVRKQLLSNVITLTTDTPHGFSIGDSISVVSTSQANISYKAYASSDNTVTITTDGRTDFQEGDVVNISLQTTQPLIKKAFDGDNVTLTTQNDHGFSVGDSVNVALATQTQSLASKSLTRNIATITTTTGNPHNFSAGDSIVVTLPISTTLTNKLVNGDTLTVTTSGAHNFALGDVVTLGFPVSANLTGNAVYSGSPNYQVTVTTTAPHNFSVGDTVSVDINNGSATNLSVYNGTKMVESTTATTITFAGYGPSASSSAAVGATAAVTNVTNSGLNGLRMITDIPSTTRFSSKTYTP